jgi:uncharacterized protein YjbI with pentapeptide repeats
MKEKEQTIMARVFDERTSRNHEWQDDSLHFANKRFQRHDFSNRTLRNADMKGCELLECNFSNSDLTAAKFQGSQLYRSTFRGATLCRANFTDAVLSGCDFTHADLRNITLTMAASSFENVVLPRQWLNSFLYLLTTTKNLPDDTKKRLIEIIGETEYQILSQAHQLL